MECPDDDTLALLLGGEADDEQALHAHIDECSRCGEVVMELAALFHDEDEGEDEGPSERATIAGRYRLERVLGRGGMGVVYLAHDTQLRREVAIKLVRPEVAAEHGDELQARLHKEARAMARLSDPAVVPVLDVGRDAGTVYVVMERVEGVTLRAWLKARPRTPAQILEVMATAGRGLGAAHRAGMVHRDFKPDNVLVGHDGRVRVTDFGMAIVPRADSVTPRSMEVSLGSASVSDSTFTRTGTVMGTPAYMAPEQIDGRSLDARSDQYAWCVVLVEALTGARPFDGRTLHALRDAQRTPPTLGGLGSRVREVVQRGLREDPAERWPDLEHAMVRLRRPAGSRWRVAAVALVSVAGWGLWPGSATSAPAVSRCSTGAAALEATWSRARTEREAGSEGTTLEREFEDHVTALTAAYQRSCDARALPSSVTADEAMDCLDRRRARLTPILERWAAEADADLLDVVTGLPGAESCFGIDEARPLPRDPERADETRRLRADLEEGWSYFALGDMDEAQARLGALGPEVEALGFAPLHAEWSLMSGRVLIRRAEVEPALERLEAAYWEAHREGDDWIAARSATALFRLLGDTLNRFDDADRWARHAESSLQRADRTIAWYHFHEARATVEIRRAEPAAARSHSEQALALALRLWPPGHPDVVSARANLAIVDTLQGDFEAAQTGLRRAIEARGLRRGEDHPDLVPMLHALAEVMSRQGRASEAELLLRRSLGIVEEAYGLDHPLASDARNGLAIVAAMRGDYDEAEPLFMENLEQAERRWGATDDRVMRLRVNLGNLRLQQGKLEEARADLLAVLAWDEERVGPSSVALVRTLLLLADVEHRRGELSSATAYLDRSMQVLVEHEDAESDLLASTLQRRGVLGREQGRMDDARADLERSLSLRRDDASRAPALIELGHLERDLGDVEQAAQHYRSALALVTEPGDPNGQLAQQSLDELSAEPVSN